MRGIQQGSSIINSRYLSVDQPYTKHSPTSFKLVEFPLAYPKMQIIFVWWFLLECQISNQGSSRYIAKSPETKNQRMPEIVRKKKYDRTTSLILVILSQTYSSGLLRSNMRVQSFKARSLINHHHAWIIWCQYVPTVLIGTSKERDCLCWINRRLKGWDKTPQKLQEIFRAEYAL